MVTEATGVPHAGSEKDGKPGSGATDRPTTVEPLETAFPNWSCRCTVAIAEHAPTATVCAVVVNTSAAGTVARIVSTCVPLVRPADAAVTVNEPADVPLK